MEITVQRGAIPLQLDRTRLVFFDDKATWLLIQKYGDRFIPELYEAVGDKDKDVRLRSMDALVYFLWAGLQAEATSLGEELTLDAAASFIKPFTYRRIFNAVLLALTATIVTPESPGKPLAPGAAAPSDADRKKAAQGPGPATRPTTRASISTRRNGSLSRR